MKYLKTLILLSFFLSLLNKLYGQQPVALQDKKNITYITGKVADCLPGDTISLVLNGQYFSYQTESLPERYAATILTTVEDKSGNFNFKIITGNSPFHVSLFLSSKRNIAGYLQGKGEIPGYLIMPGDSVNIEFKNNVQYYSGNGAALFQAQRSLNQFDPDNRKLKSDPVDNLHKNPLKWLQQKDSLLMSQLNLFTAYQPIIPLLAYRIIRADIIGANRAFVCDNIIPTLLYLHGKKAKNVDPNLSGVIMQIRTGFVDIDTTDRSALSPKYVYYLYLKMQLLVNYERLLNGSKVWDFNYFPAICNEFSGILRDKILTWWIIQSASVGDLQPDYLMHALSVMQTPSFIKVVKNLATSYNKDEVITDFNFKDEQGKIVKLANFKDQVIFVDLWFSGCSGCAHVATGLPKVESVFKDNPNIRFVSISIDRDKRTWLHSISSGKQPGVYYTTAETTYLYTAGTGGNNSFIKKYVPDGSYPSLLIIDKQGKLFSSTPSRPVNPELQTALIRELRQALTH